MYYKETLTPHQWTPLVSQNFEYIKNERQWLLLERGTEKCAFLHCYIACESHKNDGFLQWNEDLFNLLTEETIKLRAQGFTTLALGDFNSKIGKVSGLENNNPGLNKNTPMFLNFINSANLLIINTLPISKGLFTRFMEGNSSSSGTLIDYGLINPEQAHSVTSFVIDSDARFDCGSDHALLEVELTFGPKTSSQWAFHDTIQYNFKPSSDFSKFQEHLDNFSSAIPLCKFSDLTSDQMLPHITSSINKSGKESFGLKVKKNRKKGKTLPKAIIDMIKEKIRVTKELEQTLDNNDADKTRNLSSQLQDLKIDIKSKICDLKTTRRHRLRSKILKADPSRKKFWSFLKSQMKSAGRITGCYDKSGNIVFNQDEIEEAVLDHFKNVFQGQRQPVYCPNSQPDQVTLAELELQNILEGSALEVSHDKFEEQVCSPISFTELEGILGKLSNGKSCGYDAVPNEFLKNSTKNFKMYILIFLNKIIADGRVPEALNLGKVMLIYKVCENNNLKTKINFIILRVGTRLHHLIFDR